jgi:hypothetical protein
MSIPFPPNLDAMSPEDLRAFGDNLQRLANYAFMKANAMNDRSKGRIDDALRAESICEQVYHLLPDEWRW